MEATPKVRWYKRSAAWRRLTADAGAVAVGGNAAYLSWGHIVETSLMFHQEGLAAFLYPVSIDGMMIVGVVKAADDRATGRKVRWWARFATWLGGGISIAAQILSAIQYGWMAAGWAMVPSITLIVVVEVQARRGRKLAAKELDAAIVSDTAVPSEVPAAAPAPVVVTVPAPEPVPASAPVEEEAPVVDVEPVVVETPRKPRRRRAAVGYPSPSTEELDAAGFTASKPPATVAMFVEAPVETDAMSMVDSSHG